LYKSACCASHSSVVRIRPSAEHRLQSAPNKIKEASGAHENGGFLPYFVFASSCHLYWSSGARSSDTKAKQRKKQQRNKQLTKMQNTFAKMTKQKKMTIEKMVSN